VSSVEGLSVVESVDIEYVWLGVW